jgi:hypothetical protein
MAHSLHDLNKTVFRVQDMANLNKARSQKNSAAELENLINMRLSGDESLNLEVELDLAKYKLVLSSHPSVMDQHFILRYQSGF